MKIGSLSIKNNLFLAPMAGVTDRPFRMLCKKLGAGVAVSEMVTSNSLLYGSEKTIQRANHEGEVDPISVQIAGADPIMMGDAARYNEDKGAQIIDINMGCPAKKICNVMAGSALLKHEKLVEKILTSVVSAVTIPVTLKIRTGWDKENKNAINIAKIAENSGIQALAIHGRTRACLYHGEAEYDTIANVKQNIKIPVIANGDITSPQKAEFVLNYTKADGVMIGRAAQGRPWIFREIDYYLKNKKELELPTIEEIQETTIEHVNDLYNFYGELKGLRIARKHISWYTKGLKSSAQFRFNMNQIEDATNQQKAINDYFENLKINGKFIPYENENMETLVA
ncbi:MAG: tRNA dihydrouridine synthase DusB [Proteobacteria bacterium]|jgi:tRNA-dihydrouridine synthase B|nr:tRNA dihydrouridine synthase DusB [Pseudomonadota bacterium]MDA0872710.1 tRNA dihydrouridine synthase DusB [Pseudomonadota bacterium]MDA1133341.1 tRNA dihydrouridine synthase DusB [Pseudomonadota bacterium]